MDTDGAYTLNCKSLNWMEVLSAGIKFLIVLHLFGHRQLRIENKEHSYSVVTHVLVFLDNLPTNCTHFNVGL